MSQHFATVAKRNSPLTGRVFEQSRALVGGKREKIRWERERAGGRRTNILQDPHTGSVVRKIMGQWVVCKHRSRLCSSGGRNLQKAAGGELRESKRLLEGRRGQVSYMQYWDMNAYRWRGRGAQCIMGSLDAVRAWYAWSLVAKGSASHSTLGDSGDFK